MLGGTPDQGRITLLLDGGEEERRLRGGAQGAKARREHRRQVWPDRQWVRQWRRTPQLLFGQRLRQLDECQRIATGRGDDVVGDGIVEHAASRRRDEGTRVGCGQPLDIEAWQSFELDSWIVRFAGGDEHCHALGPESAGDEGDHRCRLVVQPLRVVDDHQHRLNSSGLAEQAQHRQRDDERVERRVLDPAERGVECVALSVDKGAGVVEDRTDQLVHTGIPERRLRLDAGDPQDAELRRLFHRVVEQRGLPDARWSRHDHGSARSRRRTAEQSVDARPFVDPLPIRHPCALGVSSPTRRPPSRPITST